VPVLPSIKLFTHQLTKATLSYMNPRTSQDVRTWSLRLLELLGNAGDDPEAEAGHRQGTGSKDLDQLQNHSKWSHLS